MIESYSQIKKYCDDRGVTLVAISKTKTPEEISDIYNAGHRIFGENKVQELIAKHEVLPRDIQWHLVGHLQTNKVRFIAPFVSLIHSVESWKLLEEINTQAKKNNHIVDVLLQIHIAQEESKFGLSFDEAKNIFQNEKLKSLSNICIKGLMGMATLTKDESQIRNEFRTLRELFSEVKQRATSNLKPETLSMGMSSDYQIAIEEGSTMVRIGSAIFGERKK